MSLLVLSIRHATQQVRRKKAGEGLSPTIALSDFQIKYLLGHIAD